MICEQVCTVCVYLCVPIWDGEDEETVGTVNVCCIVMSCLLQAITCRTSLTSVKKVPVDNIMLHLKRHSPCKINEKNTLFPQYIA